jgi:hypothetical protein
MERISKLGVAILAILDHLEAETNEATLKACFPTVEAGAFDLMLSVLASAGLVTRMSGGMVKSVQKQVPECGACGGTGATHGDVRVHEPCEVCGGSGRFDPADD